MSESLRISFRLTRIQRALNPLESLIMSLLGIALIIIGAFTLLIRSDSVVSWLLFGGATMSCWLFLGRPLRHLFRSLFCREYINTLVIEDDGTVHFGIDNPNFTVRWTGSARAQLGLCGTVVIVWPTGCSITFPKSAASIAYIKSALNGTQKQSVKTKDEQSRAAGIGQKDRSTEK
jgi:hypothetical protein